MVYFLLIIKGHQIIAVCFDNPFKFQVRFLSRLPSLQPYLDARCNYIPYPDKLIGGFLRTSLQVWFVTKTGGISRVARGEREIRTKHCALRRPRQTGKWIKVHTALRESGSAGVPGYNATHLYALRAYYMRCARESTGRPMRGACVGRLDEAW